MPALRFGDLEAKPTTVLDMTSLTIEEIRQLVPAFEAAFAAHMAVWRLDGKPRTARRYSTYSNCPLPTPEDRLLFILIYMKTNPLQVAHGLLFDLPQGKTNQWIHVLLPVLRATFRQLGYAPSRSLEALAQRLGQLDESSHEHPMVERTDELAPAPLFVTTELNGASCAPTIRLNRKAVIAARKSAIP